MNKFLLATALLIPAFTFAATEEATFSAISSRGNCEIFTSKTEIPSTWKTVDTCDKYENSKTGQRMDNVVNRRWLKRLNAKKATPQTKKTTRSNTRIGSGRLTRGGRDRVTKLKTTKQQPQPRRTTTKQRLGTTKQYLLNDSRRQTKSKEEGTQRRRIKSGSATQMNRTGKLSGKYWSTESSQRNERLSQQESTNGWKKYLNNRQHLSKQGRTEKKEYKYNGLSLRRMYRGTRLEGNISN